MALGWPKHHWFVWVSSSNMDTVATDNMGNFAAAAVSRRSHSHAQINVSVPLGN